MTNEAFDRAEAIRVRLDQLDSADEALARVEGTHVSAGERSDYLNAFEKFIGRQDYLLSDDTLNGMLALAKADLAAQRTALTTEFESL